MSAQWQAFRIAIQLAVQTLILLSLVFVGAASLAYAFLVEPSWLRIRHVVIPVRGALRDLDGLRILHLSDLHVGNGNPRLTRMLGRAARIESDVVVITGDFVETHDGIPALRSVMVPLLERNHRPVIGVLGNHDRYRYPRHWPGARGVESDASALVDALRAIGVTLLIDGTITVPTSAGEIRFAGVDIWSHTRRGIVKALGESDAEGTVLLAHSPDVILGAAAERIPLVLVGHTHGGQVRLPWFTPRTATRIRIKPPTGLHRSQGTWMYVNPGLGTTLFPLRFLARPEATVIELRADEGT